MHLVFTTQSNFVFVVFFWATNEIFVSTFYLALGLYLYLLYYMIL